jgi:hypothetical protein
MNSDDPIYAHCQAEEEDAASDFILSTPQTGAGALAPADPTLPSASASTDAMSSDNSKEKVGFALPLQRPAWVSHLDRAFLVCREVHIKPVFIL